MKFYRLWTDGGCWPNPGPGGWAYILEDSDGERVDEAWGAERKTTNNRMELTAILRGLQRVPEFDEKGKQTGVIVRSDSEYCIKGASLWLPGWIRKRKLGSMKNPDLWQEIADFKQRLVIRWKWVRGHDGVPQNEECDLLCQRAMQELEQEQNDGENAEKAIRYGIRSRERRSVGQCSG